MFLPKYTRDPAALFFNIPLLAFAAATVLFLCLNLFLYYTTHGVQAEFEVITNTPEKLKFYWRDDGQEYDENRSVKVNISPDKTSYKCFLPSSSRIDNMRLDPAEGSTEFLFKNLVLKQRGFSPVILFSNQDIPVLKNLYQITSVEPVKGGGIKITTSGKDPRIEFSMPAQYPLANFTYLFIILFLLCFAAAVGTLFVHYFFHPVLLKGRLEDGQITLTFPFAQLAQCTDHALALLENKCKKYKLLSATENEGLIVYKINFSILSPDTLPELLRELQILCPGTRCQVFYNRSGEV